MTKQSEMSRYHKDRDGRRANPEGQTSPPPPPCQIADVDAGAGAAICTQRSRAWPSWNPGPSPDRDSSPLGHPKDHRHAGLVDIITETSQKASFTPLRIAPL